MSSGSPAAKRSKVNGWRTRAIMLLTSPHSCPERAFVVEFSRRRRDAPERPGGACRLRPGGTFCVRRRVARVRPRRIALGQAPRGRGRGEAPRRQPSRLCSHASPIRKENTMTLRRFRIGLVAALLCVVPASAARGELPAQDWTRTETRTDCASYNPLRTPVLRRDPHPHELLGRLRCSCASATTPRDAYMFAQGAPDRPAALRRDGPADALRAAPPPARFHRGHRPRGVARRDPHLPHLRSSRIRRLNVPGPSHRDQRARRRGSTRRCRPSSSLFSSRSRARIRCVSVSAAPAT